VEEEEEEEEEAEERIAFYHRGAFCSQD